MEPLECTNLFMRPVGTNTEQNWNNLLKSFLMRDDWILDFFWRKKSQPLRFFNGIFFCELVRPLLKYKRKLKFYVFSTNINSRNVEVIINEFFILFDTGLSLCTFKNMPKRAFFGHFFGNFLGKLYIFLHETFRDVRSYLKTVE